MLNRKMRVLADEVSLCSNGVGYGGSIRLGLSYDKNTRPTSINTRNMSYDDPKDTKRLIELNNKRKPYLYGPRAVSH